MIRRIIQFGFRVFASLSLLLFLATAALWVRSYWVKDFLKVTRDRWDLEVTTVDGPLEVFGAHDVRSGRGDEFTFLSFARTQGRFRGWRAFDFDYQPAGPQTDPDLIEADTVRIIVPFWAVCLGLAVLPTIWLTIVLRRRRKRRQRMAQGLCIRCGYDLRASAGKCPKCGAEPIVDSRKRNLRADGA